MSGVRPRMFNGETITMTAEEAEAFDAAVDVLKIILTNAGYPLTDLTKQFSDPHTTPTPLFGIARLGGVTTRTTAPPDLGAWLKYLEEDKAVKKKYDDEAAYYDRDKREIVWKKADPSGVIYDEIE